MTISTSNDQQMKATQLLAASVKHSYDPQIDIDWDAASDPGKWYLPERFCSLHGTPIWGALSEEQKIECSRQELVGSLSMGVWTEYMLLQMVARYVYNRPVTDPGVHYALTEVADECRHMIMFSKLIDNVGGSALPTPRRTHFTGLALKTASPVISLWALILLTEEIFEQIQREMSRDESLQRVVRAVSRIHIVEEARHIGYARAELERVIPTLNRTQLEALRFLLAAVASNIPNELANKTAYARAGLDANVAHAQARDASAFRDQLKWAAERVTKYYREIGLIGGPSRRIWTRAGLL